MIFSLKKIEVDGRDSVCVVREEDGLYEHIQTISALMDLAKEDIESYNLVVEFLFLQHSRLGFLHSSGIIEA